MEGDGSKALANEWASPNINGDEQIWAGRCSGTLELPENLLSGYGMQWALNRQLGLLSGGQMLLVNAYKLATQSLTFRRLIKEIDDPQCNQEVQKYTINEPPPLIIDCHRRSDVDDLALAIHYCHLGQCQISLSSVVGGSKMKPANRFDLIYSDEEDSNLILSASQLHLTTTKAECSLACGLRVASTYGIESLHEQCINKLKENLNMENCWYLWKTIFTPPRFPVSQTVHQIDKKAGQILIDFMQENFRKFPCGIVSEELKYFSAPEMELILASSRLNVRSESEIIETIEKWTETQLVNPHDVKTVSKIVPRLVQHCIRFEMIELKEIDRLLQLPGMQIKKGETGSQCVWRLHHHRRRLVRKARNLRSLSPPSDQSESVSSKRDCRIPHEAIVVFGGWENDQTSRRVRVFDARQKLWKTYDTNSRSSLLLPHPLMSFGIVNVENRAIYIAGGESIGGQATQEVLRYEFRCHKSGWKGCAPMHDVRRDFVLINYQNKTLFAIGGDNNRTVLNSVEALILETGISSGWLEVASMIIPRGAPAGDVLGSLIYICGGYTESRMESLTNSCETYNPETNQWTMIQPMYQPRYYAGAVTYQNHLYVLGGGGDTTPRSSTSVMNMGYSSTVERFTPGEGGTWELMPPISERADFAACILEDEIYCIGGGGETFCTGNVESWRPWVGRIRRSERSGTQQHPMNDAISGQNEISSPIWMALSENEEEAETPIATESEDGERLDSWHRGVQLPQPLWGHRCVTISGVDKVIQLLGIKANQRYKPPFRPPERVAIQQWRIKKSGENKILAVVNTYEPISGNNDEDEVVEKGDNVTVGFE
ncbi:hypothetical protein Aperf_G00000067867 [Anoplocephala perfoliata]